MGASHRKLLPTAGARVANSDLTTDPKTAPDARSGISLKGRHGVYVYCIVRGATAPNVATREARLPGAGAPRALPLGTRTWLVAADVPLDIYGELAVQRRFKDLDWVAACGVAHQAMVDACMRHDAVIPMKVFTIFTSVSRARVEMKRHGDRLRTLMHQVAGCVEWGVRVTRAPQPARELQRQTSLPWAEPATASDTSASGRAFLEAKARQRGAVRDAAAALQEHIRALAHTLSDVTRDVRYRADATRGAVPVLLDAAYLVPRGAEKRFRAQVRIKAQPLLARGCRVTVTGPWPAYSFVSPAER
jgi:hypothetical protein